MIVGVGDGVGEGPLPLAVGELVAIQGLQLAAQVGNEVGLFMKGKILIALLDELNKVILTHLQRIYLPKSFSIS